MIPLSPGLIQGCFELLVLSTRQRLTIPEVVAAFASLGGLPSTSVVQTAQSLNWLEVNEPGYVEPTLSGKRLLSVAGYEAQLRQALLDYVDVRRPSWIQNASFGRGRVLSFAGSQIAQVFVEAGLVDGISDEVVAFWDALAARSRGQRDARLNDIGRKGEKLTIEYESNRTGRRPSWTAVDNNADGYDVLSVVTSSDLRKLTIEVKTSTMGDAGRFFLTRNEWDRATESERHVFHLWDISKENRPRLALVSATTMVGHIPVDQGMGQWNLVEVPYSSFKDLFF